MLQWHSTGGIRGNKWSYHIRETANHDITVHYGDGTSDRFRLTLSPNSSGLVPIRLVEVGFTCQTSQGVTLELAGDNSAGLEGGMLIWEDESKFDEITYVLTTKDRTKVYLTAEKGVHKIEDSLGNMITVDEDGYHGEGNKGITLTRNEEGLITSATDGNGKTVSYGYDENKDLVSFTNEAGHSIRFTYDGEHNLASIIDPMGVATARNEYDENGRLIATIDAEGNRMEYAYDVEGRTQAVQDRRGNTTVHTYDENGNILKTVDALGNATYNTYDGYGNLLTVTDGNGNTTSYTYDGNGNVTRIVAADGTKIQNAYRQDNCLTSIRMMDRTIIAMDYDDRGRITGVTDGNQNRTSYEYTGDGKLSSIAAIYEVAALVHLEMFAYLSAVSINELTFALCAGAVGNNKAALVHTVLAVLSIGGAMYELSLSGVISVTGPKGTVEVDIKGKANKGSKKTVDVNGKTVTMDNSIFDPNFVDKQGRTNIQRMEQGLAPIGTDGKSVNIHHIDQTNNGPVMEITATEHQQNYSDLHINIGQSPSQINRVEFNNWRRGYWEWRSNNLE